MLKMIGIFDSGAGGLNALYEIRKLKPSIDICFYADRKNAPYGTKTEKELLSLVKRDISRLRAKGAEYILMACCTASTVYEKLPRQMRDISLPIIEPTARAALRATRNGKISIIATDATINSGAFQKCIEDMGGADEVVTQRAQRLVKLVEDGAYGKRLKGTERDEIFEIIKSVKEKNTDTLIMGCTHFQRLERELAGMLPEVRIISSAREGAREMARHTGIYGHGRTFYI